MKAPVIVLAVACVIALVIGVSQRREVKSLRLENAALRAELEALRVAIGGAAEQSHQRDVELQKLRDDAQQLVKLRGEVTQLRSAGREIEKLRAENQKLRDEPGKTAPAPVAAPPLARALASYPRDQWKFAGYKTIEDALVSAIWSMQQGDPKQYFQSLTPDEQARILKSWEGKSPDEIIAKQKNDTAPITGFRVLLIDQASEEWASVNVAIDGVNREERVAMQQINGEWKFGGFVRDAKR